MKMKAHDLTNVIEETGQVMHVATILPAKRADVNYVLAADEDSHDGRSNWVWLRLANGDLVLGVFPQGDTYEYVTNRAGSTVP